MTKSLGGRVRTRLLATLAAAATTVALCAVSSPPAGAVGAAQPTLVSVTPSALTPNVLNGTVYGIAQVGSWIVVGGSFTSVAPHGSSSGTTYNRVFAFNQDTGALNTAFAPNIDGTVNAVIAGPSANTVYVGGAFTNVNGVKSKSIALLNLSDGSAVSGFKAPSMNGIVDDLRLVAGHLWLVGSFTTLAGVSHPGVGTLVPASGAVDPYVNIALTGHHNYNGTSGAKGAVGGRKLDINPAGTRAVIVGNFKNANGVVHDQIVLLDLGSSSATIDPNWNTSAYSAACASGSFDTYVEDVDFAPDGSYFAVVATGGGGISYDPSGSRSLCDTAARWEINATGTNVRPSWIDYTGNDTLHSVTVTGTAIYAGGHQRWINNPNGSDSAAAGAVPRPGIVALDPINGLPYSWNPGRNPRGAGAYAVLATDQGLYVGSDTDYIGSQPKYTRRKIAFFPLAGGETPPPTTTASLPANVYQAGPLPGGSTTSASADTLTTRAVSGATVGAASTVTTSGISWGATRGAFVLGNSIYYPSTDGNFYTASFNGTSVGTPTVLDAYDDPAWANVATGSHVQTHETYRGVKSNYYSEISSITGQFYSNGRIYYSLSGQTALYYRYFEPDDGVVGGTEFSVAGADFSNVEGMALSGTTLYYAKRTDGTLHAIPFVNGTPNGASDTTFDSTVDWRARSLFLYRAPAAPAVPVRYVASAGYTGLSSAPAVTVPAGVAAGSTQLLFVSTNAAGVTGTPTGLTGWTQVAKITNSTLETTVFRRSAVAGDSGKTVTVPLSASSRVDLEFADYSGVSSAALPLTSAVDSSTNTHSTPTASVTAVGSWVLSYWSDRSTGTTNWTLPSSVTARRIGIGAGGGTVSGVLSDSNASVATGTYAKQTATVNVTSGRGNMISIVLAAGS